MACQLQPDTSGFADFVTTTGATVQVGVASASGTVQITGATLNGTPAAVTAGTVTFTTAAGRNLLNLALMGSDPQEDYTVNELCDATTTNPMANGNLEDGPTRGFRIDAI